MSWTVGALGEQIDVHAWVRPESPVRVLVLTGTPDWESRYLVRALEAAGMSVTVHQDLGRAQTVATVDGLIPRAVSDLSDVDVVAVVGATSSVPAEILTSWVAERGGGLLLVGAGAGAGGFPAWSPGRTAQTIVASSIRWGGPAEIVPLPRTDLQPLGAATGRGIPVASTGLTEAGSLPTAPGEQAAIYAAADWLGRGRIYTTGFESWGWAMEAGLGDQHRQYWESVVEWLAGGLAADLTLSARPGRVAVAWEGRLEGDVPSGVRVSGPGATGTDSLPILTDPGSEARVRFVPTEVGGYEVDAGARSSLGVPVVPSTVPISWAQAALEIGGAGGRVTSEAEFFPTDPAAPLGRSRGMLWLLFISLAGLAVTGWAHRRIHGLP
jgi:hypothetical protein